MTSFNGRSRLYCRARSLVLVVLTVLFAAALFASPALALPEGRVYEKVSPLFKGGFGTNEIQGVEPGGEGVAFNSLGVFAGAPNAELGDAYEATRSASGWSTVALMPPASMAPYAVLEGFSPSLSASLWLMYLGTQNHKVEAKSVQFAVHAAGAPDTPAGFQLAGPALTAVDGGLLGEEVAPRGASADFCHVFVTAALPLLPEAEADSTEQLYDVSAGCHGEPAYTRLVALNSAGGLLSGSCVANHEGFNDISGDGSEIFFTDNEPENCLKQTFKQQLFVRVGGVRTLEVSKPLGECVGGEVPCPGWGSRPAVAFAGASEDGSRVFFTTAARLDPVSDLDSGSDLYMARIGCPGEVSGCGAGQRVVTGLTQVSHDPVAGQAAEVQGVVSVAPDGSRVYFVARGVLSEAPNQQGVSAVAGADNLYVYDSVTGQMAFVGDLCSGPGGVSCPSDLQPGTANVLLRNDTSLWEAQEKFAQTAGDGRFLVFSTYARLITTGPEADGDDAQDVYRYDAQTGSLLRVSLGEAGFDSNGNRNDGETILGLLDNARAGAGDARVQRLMGGIFGEERGVVRSAMSEDGSRIVFSTFEPLSPDAENGQVDVYEWHDGAVSLLSCGCSTGPDREPVITPSGRDVFFMSSAGLVPEDTDGALDVYDARLGGGFAAVEAPAQRCEGDACQGPLTNPVPLLVPGSAVQAPGENVIPVEPAPPVKAKAKAKASPKRCVKRRSCAKLKRKGRKASRRGHARRASTSGGRGRR
jgi:hypothetical protein